VNLGCLLGFRCSASCKGALKKSTANQKAVKVLLNNKMAIVRIDAKFKSFISTVAHLRQPNKQECEQGSTKLTALLIKYHSKGQKPFISYTLLRSFMLAPTIYVHQISIT
jgi:hypothetical protein